MILLVMGVAGSGKSTLGRALAEALGWTFIEGDAAHPAANIEKMARGEALDDLDRAPWLERLHASIADLDRQGASAVVACSALRASYRERLAAGIGEVRWVWLSGDEALIARRLDERSGHFMTAELLESQLATLESPADAIPADAIPAATIRAATIPAATVPAATVQVPIDLPTHQQVAFVRQFIEQPIERPSSSLSRVGK